MLFFIKHSKLFSVNGGLPKELPLIGGFRVA